MGAFNSISGVGGCGSGISWICVGTVLLTWGTSPGGSPGVTVLLTWGPSPGGVPLDGSAHSQSPVQMSHPPNLVGSHVGLQSYCPGGNPGVTGLLTWGPSPVNVVGVGPVAERRRRRSVEGSSGAGGWELECTYHLHRWGAPVSKTCNPCCTPHSAPRELDNWGHRTASEPQASGALGPLA